jgi:hypothetical protein
VIRGLCKREGNCPLWIVRAGGLLNTQVEMRILFCEGRREANDGGFRGGGGRTELKTGQTTYAFGERLEDSPEKQCKKVKI